MKTYVGAVLAAVLLVAAGTASADTIKVPKDYDTIGEALENAATGDTILVKGSRRMRMERLHDEFLKEARGILARVR